MKTHDTSVVTARALLCAFALFSGLFLSTSSVRAQAQDDEVRKMVDAAEAAVGAAQRLEGLAKRAFDKSTEATAAAVKAAPAQAAAMAALGVAEGNLKDAIARKEAADKGAKEADEAAQKPNATDADRQRAKEAREIARAAGEKVAAAQALRTQRSADAKIAGAPERARVIAVQKAIEAKGSLDAAKSNASGLIESASSAAKKMQNQDKQQARLQSRIGDLRAKLAAIK